MRPIAQLQLVIVNIFLMFGYITPYHIRATRCLLRDVIEIDIRTKYNTLDHAY